MEPGPRNYLCPSHGEFERVVDPALDDVWEQACPACRQPCELRQPRGLAGNLPALVGVRHRRAYLSPYLGQMVESEAQVRRLQREQGLQPLDDSDLKHEAERSESILHDKRDTDRWLKTPAAPRTEFGPGAEPDATVTAAQPMTVTSKRERRARSKAGNPFALN